MGKVRAFIIHGFMAKPSDHWFPWLKECLEQEKIDVFIPELPDSGSPKLDEWMATLQNDIGSAANTWLIAHSLGCVTILRLLERLPEDEMPQGIILVSGFNESLPLWKQYGLTRMEEFTSPPVEMKRTIKKIKHRYVIASLNDMIVPTEMSLRLSQQLNAPFYALPDSGHFLGDDGITELPLVLELLKNNVKELTTR